MIWTTEPPKTEGTYWVLDHYYDGVSKLSSKTVFNVDGRELTYWSNKKKSPVSVTLIDNPKIVLRKWSSEPAVLPEG